MLFGMTGKKKICNKLNNYFSNYLILKNKGKRSYFSLNFDFPTIVWGAKNWWVQ